MNDKTPLRELKGVGDKTEKLFQKVGIYDTDDLLHYYPSNYVEFKEFMENKLFEKYQKKIGLKRIINLFSLEDIIVRQSVLTVMNAN